MQFTTKMKSISSKNNIHTTSYCIFPINKILNYANSFVFFFVQNSFVFFIIKYKLILCISIQSIFLKKYNTMAPFLPTASVLRRMKTIPAIK